MPSWRPDSLVELPNGRLVCKSHRLVVCGTCTVDCSFMDDVLDDEYSFSEICNDSDDSMPDFEDIADESHFEQDLEADTEYDVGALRLAHLLVRSSQTSQHSSPRSLFLPQLPILLNHFLRLRFQLFMVRMPFQRAARALSPPFGRSMFISVIDSL